MPDDEIVFSTTPEQDAMLAHELGLPLPLDPNVFIAALGKLRAQADLADAADLMLTEAFWRINAEYSEDSS